MEELKKHKMHAIITSFSVTAVLTYLQVADLEKRGLGEIFLLSTATKREVVMRWESAASPV